MPMQTLYLFYLKMGLEFRQSVPFVDYVLGNFDENKWFVEGVIEND